MLRLGVVSFLNSRPLVEGLTDDPRVALRFDVPARLPALLDCGAVDAALVPIVDVLRRTRRADATGPRGTDATLVGHRLLAGVLRPTRGSAATLPQASARRDTAGRGQRIAP